MDEKLLRDLIKLVAQTALFGVAGRALSSNSSGQSEPTGLKAFLPWLRPKSTDASRSPEQKKDATPPAMLTSREWAEQHTAEIMRSVLGDSARGGDGAAGESSEETLKAAISGSINQQTPRPSYEADTNSAANLKSVIAGSVEQQDAVASGNEPPEQPTVPGIEQTPPAGRKEPSQASNAMDAVQLVLDVIGAFDPTPITDGANSLISVGRAIFTDPERRKEHLQNAAISAVSMIPYVGDTAKLAKVPRAAKTVGRTASMARGTDRANSTIKAMTAAEKKATRNSLRETAGQAISSSTGEASQQDEDSHSATQGSSVTNQQAAGNGSSVPPDSPPVMSPSPGPDENKGSKDRTDEAEGVNEYYEWRDALKDTGKKLLDFGGILGKGAGKALAFIEGLRLLNTGVLALNRDLAAYNGQIATAYAKSDAADIRRDMRKANALSGPLSGLSVQQSELKDKIQAGLEPLQVIAIKTLEELTRLTNETLRFIEVMMMVVPGAKEAFELYKKLAGDKQDSGTAVMQFFQDVSDGKFDGKRPGFINPKFQILEEDDHKKVFGK
jgi:hypothetical protein